MDIASNIQIWNLLFFSFIYRDGDNIIIIIIIIGFLG